MLNKLHMKLPKRAFAPRFLAFAIVLFFIGMAAPLWAQPEKEFNTDPKEFIKELDQYMNAGRNEDCRLAFEAFKELYEGGKVVESRFQSILTICNGMLTRKMRANPYFLNYFQAANALLVDDAASAKHFSRWSEVTMIILNNLKGGKYSEYSNFLQFSIDIFKEKALYYTPNGPIWRCTSSDFVMSYDTGQVALTYFKTDVFAVRKTDTIYIKNTSGVYFPLKWRWEGNEAIVDWERTGLNGVRCTFPKYTVNTKETVYRAPVATLIHPTLFDGPVMGTFEDKVVVSGENTVSQYPRFESFEKRVKLNDIGDRIEYFGGFKLYGAQIQGYGTTENPAEIRLYDSEKRLAVRAFSVFFNIKKDDRILSENTRVSIYFDNDSIYHPGIDFRYTIPKHTLKLSQGAEGSGKTPFFNSFQNIEMFVRSLEWDIDQPLLEIGKGDIGSASRREVIFESLNLFDLLRYERYHNVSNMNAVAKVVTFWRNLMTLKKLDAKKIEVDYRMILADTNDRKVLSSLEKVLGRQVQNLDSVREEVKYLDEFERKMPARYISWMLLGNNDVSSIGRMINDMVGDGFIFYDAESKVVTLRDKLFHYNDASINKVDFDLIRIKSVYTPPSNKYGYDSLAIFTKQVNAVFDMRNKSLTANWVRKVMLSDTQRVYIEPLDEELKIFGNRNMNFSGTVRAGSSIFFRKEKDFTFNYERFEINADSIDFMEFLIKPRGQDPNGFYFPYPEEDSGAYFQTLLILQTRLEQLQGILLIDAPNNKSGKDDIKIFPSFECTNSPFAFYDADYIRGGAYKRDRFYFQLDPFIQDTLDHFDPNYLRFEGKLVSADIFPDVKEPLRVMWHDLSLGFEAETPKAGYPIYKGKGRFTKYFGISNLGLIGNGTVEYLVSKFVSDDIVFYPDSMLATSDGFNIEETMMNGVEFPKVVGDLVKLRWFPYQDEMRIRSAANNPFKFFKSGDYSLSGELVLTPKGINGDGKFSWEEAEMSSRRMLFGRNRVDADTAEVSIKALQTEAGENAAVAFNTRNVEAHFDFDKKIGEFTSNDPNQLNTDLPYSRYKTSLSDFKWDMEAKKINLASSNNQNGFFLATDDGMDSLIFSGSRADYDLVTNLLRIDGVEFIKVADAFIKPQGQHIEIAKGADMDTLYDAQIVADTSSKYHVINRAKVKIKGKFNYEADGYYEFNVADRAQEIRFNNIVSKRRDRKYITEGSGNIAEADGFILDKKIRFYGTASLSANQPNIDFGGYAKLNTKVIPPSDWFKIKSKVDRKNVVIDYDIPYNPDNQKIYTGVWLYRDSMHIYTTVMAPRVRPVDREIYTVKGQMRYNGNADEFIFTDSTFLQTGGKYGKKMTVSDETGKVKAEGIFEFGTGLPGVSLQTAGELETYLGSADYNFKLTAGIRMILPDILSDIIVGDLNSSPADAIPVDYTKALRLQKSLNEIIRDEKKVDKMMKKVDEGLLDVPAELGFTFLFPELKMAWSAKQQSFLTSQATFGIAAIKGKAINQMVRGNIEFGMNARGDVLTIMFESTISDNKYFFTYQKGILQIFSTNENFTNAVIALKKKDKEFKLPDGTDYIIELGSQGAMNAFAKRAKDR